MTTNELKNALQGGKASKKMKNVWMWRWALAPLALIIPFAALEIMITGMGPEDEEFVFILPPGFLWIILLICLIVFVVVILFCRLWAGLYWKNYSFELQDDRIVIKRGVIGKRTANIPYERIQNVNIWKGILERIYGLSTVRIETAGGVQFGGGGYGTMLSLAEGTIQGLEDPEVITEYIMSRVRGKDGLGDIGSGTGELTPIEKMGLLEERLLKGDISEETYKDLKRKIEGSE